MNFYENNEVANLILDKLNILFAERLINKKLIESISRGFNDALRCYYFVDKNENNIFIDLEERRKFLYDVELLYVKWNFYKDVRQDSLYIFNIKEFSIFSLITNCEKVNTVYIDDLCKENNSKCLMKIYAYDNKAFNSIEEIIEYERRKKS